jgi:hypothetical protein
MSGRVAIAAVQLLLSVLILGGVWFGLPARWVWVDVPATALAVAASLAAIALLKAASWALAVARAVLWAELIIGTLAASLLAMSAAQLAGSYGPVGAGGAVLLITIALLVLPYLVVFPALQLRWLRQAK